MARTARKKVPHPYSYAVSPLYPKAQAHVWSMLRDGCPVLVDLAVNVKAAEAAAKAAIASAEHVQDTATP